MLGFVIAEGRGVADRLLVEAATRLRAEGHLVIGAVQVNEALPDGDLCGMDLHLLEAGQVVRISQNLGPMARGCRLDAGRLEQAVGLVGAALQGGRAVDLLIVNKFGKQEIDGRGFRPLIGEALAAGVPVLISLRGASRDAFETFAGGMAAPVAPEIGAILDWCRAAMDAASPRQVFGGSGPVAGREYSRHSASLGWLFRR